MKFNEYWPWYVPLESNGLYSGKFYLVITKNRACAETAIWYPKFNDPITCNWTIIGKEYHNFINQVEYWFDDEYLDFQKFFDVF